MPPRCPGTLVILVVGCPRWRGTKNLSGARGDCRSSGRVSGVTADEGPPAPPARPSVRRIIVRVLLAAGAFLAIAELGALVLSEYVGTSVFSWLLPGLLGAGSGELASSVSYPVRRPPPALAAVAVTFAAGIAAPIVAAVQAFQIADIPYGPAGRWLPPVAASAGGAVLMWLLPAPGGRNRAGHPAHPDDVVGEVRSGPRPLRRRPGSRRSAGPDRSTR